MPEVAARFSPPFSLNARELEGPSQWVKPFVASTVTIVMHTPTIQSSLSELERLASQRHVG